jgi:hypothetical protein
VSPAPSRSSPTGRRAGLEPGAGRRALRVVVLLLVPGIVAVVAGVLATGAAAAPAFGDPGADVRWALPLARLVGDLAGSLTLGLLIAASALPPSPGSLRPSQRAVPAVLQGACACAVVWTLASAGRLVLRYAAETGQGLGEPSLGSQLESYVTQADEGRWAAAAVAAAALIATLAAGTTRRRAAAVLAVLVLAALIAQAFSDSAAARARSVADVVLLWLHVAGAAAAVGGIGALLLLAPGSSVDLAGAAPRLARSAAPVLALVGVSGLAAAARAPSAWAGTGVTWALIGVKVVALAALAVLIRRLKGGVSAPASPRLAAVLAGSLTVAAVAVGLGVALALGGG